MATPVKTCRICGEEKPATAEFFYPRKGAADGLRSECKPCLNARNMRAHHGENYGAFMAGKHEQGVLTKQGLKRCTSCGDIHPASAEFFNHHKRSRDGLYQHCKSCARNRDAQRPRSESFAAKQRERETLSEQGLKRCASCGTIHPATTEFFACDRNRAGGLTPQCKPCRQKRYLNRYHGNNLETFLAQKQMRHSLKEQGLKQCTACQQIYPATAEFFHKQLKMSDGLNSHCKSCALAYAEQLRGRRSPEQWARKREYQREWDRQPSNKKRATVYRNRRRARKRSLPDEFTAQDWGRCLAYWNHRCAVCNRPAGLWTAIASDHWIPLSGGGPTLPSNMIPLCHSKKGVPDGDPCCNTSKGSSMPDVWLKRRFGEKKSQEIMARVQAYFDWLKDNPS